MAFGYLGYGALAYGPNVPEATTPVEPPPGAGVGHGAVNWAWGLPCVTEYYTNGWVGCGDIPVEEVIEARHGGRRFPFVHREYYPITDEALRKEQLMREDDELLSIIAAAIQTRIIQ